jgi:hypothetical protein
MAKYGKKAQEKVEETMHEFKHGELKSGFPIKLLCGPRRLLPHLWGF